MKVRVRTDPSFERGLLSLPPDRAKGAAAALLKFQAEPGLPGLKFRLLQGRRDHYIINGKHGDRIILRKEKDDLYAAVDVGPHDNILRKWG